MKGPGASRAMRWWLAVALVLPLAVPAANAQTPSLAPEQPHVTLATDGVVVHFAYTDLTGPAPAPQVVYRIDGGDEASVAAAPVGTVVPTVATDGVATEVWAATVPAPAGATIQYRVDDPLRGSLGPFEVRRPREDGAIRLVALGDIGYDGVQPDGSGTPAASAPIAVRDLALAQDADALLIPGDLAYLNSRAGWDRFMRMHAPLQATVPVVPAIGNHEWEDPVGYGQYLAEYVLPGEEQDYVQALGPATVIVVNSDAACVGLHHRSNGPLHKPCENGVDEARLAWLRAALQEADGDARPWTVVMMHHPPYSWGRHGSDWVTHVHYAPLFEEHGVDLVLTAHDHLYGRTHPVVQREPQDTQTPYPQGAGPVYAVVGGGGRELYDLPVGEPPAWLAHGEKVHHLAVLDIDEATLRFEAKRVDGSTMDTFSLTREAQLAGPAGADPEQAPAPGLSLLVLAGLALAATALRRR